MLVFPLCTYCWNIFKQIMYNNLIISGYFCHRVFILDLQKKGFYIGSVFIYACKYLQGRLFIASIKMSMLLIWLLLYMTDWVILMGQLMTMPRWRGGPMCCFLAITLETWECLMVWTMILEYQWVFCKFSKLSQHPLFLLFHLYKKFIILVYHLNKLYIYPCSLAIFKRINLPLSKFYEVITTCTYILM